MPIVHLAELLGRLRRKQISQLAEQQAVFLQGQMVAASTAPMSVPAKVSDLSIQVYLPEIDRRGQNHLPGRSARSARDDDTLSKYRSLVGEANDT